MVWAVLRGAVDSRLASVGGGGRGKGLVERGVERAKIRKPRLVCDVFHAGVIVAQKPLRSLKANPHDLGVWGTTQVTAAGEFELTSRHTSGAGDFFDAQCREDRRA